MMKNTSFKRKQPHDRKTSTNLKPAHRLWSKTHRRFMKPLPPIALPHLADPEVNEESTFTREEVAEIFGGAIHRSLLSRIQPILGGIEPRKPIKRSSIWNVYVFLCWRDWHHRLGFCHTWHKSFVEEFQELGEKDFLDKYVYSRGGSREDCERMIEQYEVKRSTKKLIV